MAVIIVTGTPATGKTVYAKRLADDLCFTYVDVKRIIREQHLDTERDDARDCLVIDEQKLCDLLMRLRGDLVIDSHLAQHLPSSFVTLCIVVKCPLPLLGARLEARGYAPAKVRENLDSEIFDVCLVEAAEAGHETFILYSEEDYGRLLSRARSLTGQRP